MSFFLKKKGMSDDPPRYMGEGFVLMSTNDLELYFYMDEPGLVPEEPVLVTLANGDIVESSPPQWGVDVKCGKGYLKCCVCVFLLLRLVYRYGF